MRLSHKVREHRNSRVILAQRTGSTQMRPLGRLYPASMIVRARGLHEIVARNLRAERAAQRLRQADVADRSAGRLSRTQIANLESGARRVDLDDLPVLCEALGITLRELLEGADTRTRKALGL